MINFLIFALKKNAATSKTILILVYICICQLVSLTMELTWCMCLKTHKLPYIYAKTLARSWQGHILMHYDVRIFKTQSGLF